MTEPLQVCDRCGLDNIRQQITFMFNPNKVPDSFDTKDGTCEDYYWCMDCEDECDIEELSDEPKARINMTSMASVFVGEEDEEDQVGPHVFKANSMVDDCKFCGHGYTHKIHV